MFLLGFKKLNLLILFNFSLCFLMKRLFLFLLGVLSKVFLDLYIDRCYYFFIGK